MSYGFFFFKSDSIQICHRFNRYFTDSLNNIIYAYDYDDGEISNRRIFADCLALGLPERTYPDGLCLDSEGCIWSARYVTRMEQNQYGTHISDRWGGSKVIRHAKDGSISFEIQFPKALNVTACCFGGASVFTKWRIR